MKICSDHWNALRTAVEERGLSQFVSKDGETAVKRLTSAFSNTADDADSFDPLMQANFAIWGNAMDAFGSAIVAEGAPCPLCALDQHIAECKDTDCHRESGADWIKFAADEQLQAAQDMGLMGKPN